MSFLPEKQKLELEAFSFPSVNAIYRLFPTQRKEGQCPTTENLAVDGPAGTGVLQM